MPGLPCESFPGFAPFVSNRPTFPARDILDFFGRCAIGALRNPHSMRHRGTETQRREREELSSRSSSLCLCASVANSVFCAYVGLGTPAGGGVASGLTSHGAQSGAEGA